MAVASQARSSLASSSSRETTPQFCRSLTLCDIEVHLSDGIGGRSFVDGSARTTGAGCCIDTGPVASRRERARTFDVPVMGGIRRVRPDADVGRYRGGN